MSGAGGPEVGRISIRVVPDLDRFREELYAELQAAERGAKVKVKVEADMNGLREKVAAETQNLSNARVKVKSELDQTAFAKTLAEAKAAADSAGVKLRVNFHDAEAETKLAALIATLKAEAAAAKIKLNVEVDRPALDRAEGVFRGLKNKVANLFEGGGGGGVPLGSFADTAALVAAVASIIAPAMALIAGAISALPALLAGILVPIGAVALGFNGIKKAAEAAGFLSEGKKGKTGIGPSIKALQDTLSQKFQDGFTPIFQKLAPLIPAIGTGLLPVADGVIKVAQSLTDMVTSTTGLQAIETIFANIGKAMQVAAPGIANLAEGLLLLTSGGSNSLPAFGKLFGDMGTAVDSWVKDVTKPDFWGTSKLDRALMNFIGVAREIGGLFGDTFKQAFDMMADPKFAQSMKDFVKDFREIVDRLIPALKQLFTDLGPLVHDLAQLIPKSQPDTPKDPNAGKPLTGKNSWFPGFLPEAGDNLMNALGFANFPAMLATLLAGGFANALKLLSGFFTSAAAVVSEGVSVVLTFFNNLPLTIGNLFSNLGGAFSGIWDGVVAEAQNAFSGVVAAVQNVPGQIVGILSSIGGAFSGTWEGIVTEGANIMGRLVEIVQTKGGEILNFFYNLPGQIMGALAGLAEQMFSAGASAVQRFIDGLRSIDVVAAAGSILGGVMSLIPHSPAKTGPFASQGWNQIYTGGQSVGQQFSDGLQNGFQGVIESATSLMQQVQDILNQGGTLSPQLKSNIRQELKAIGVEYDQLKVQRDQTGDKAQKQALSDQMKQLQTLRDQLKLQSDQVGYADQYSQATDSTNEAAQMITKALSSMLDMGKNFVMSNVSQFEQDLGISGRGAIPQIAEQGIGWAMGALNHMISGAFGGGQNGAVNIHVNSVDDALAARQNLVNKQALGIAGR